MSCERDLKACLHSSSPASTIGATQRASHAKRRRKACRRKAPQLQYPLAGRIKPVAVAWPLYRGSPGLQARSVVAGAYKSPACAQDPPASSAHRARAAFLIPIHPGTVPPPALPAPSPGALPVPPCPPAARPCWMLSGNFPPVPSVKYLSS